MKQTLYIAFPRGFCAGVQRAIDIVEECLKRFPSPIYVNHEIVHNKFVVEDLRSRGVIFSDDLDSVSENATYIFSAHGVSPIFRKKAEEKNLRLIDATCPLVSKVHTEAEMFLNKGYEIFYIGQRDHQETIGTMGIADMQLLEKIEDVANIDSEKYKEKQVVCLTQTTLAIPETHKVIDALKEKIPHLRVPGDICYATTNRQKALLEMTKKCDGIIVVGSVNSSNSNKLVKLSLKEKIPAILIDNVTEIPEEMFALENIGLTSGASVPEKLVLEVVEKFQKNNPTLKVEPLQVCEEKVLFPMPPELLGK